MNYPPNLFNCNKFEILTNGISFKIRAIFEKYSIDIGEYFSGCESLGYKTDGIFYFNSKQEAFNWIKQNFGDSGIAKLNDSWHPC